MFIPAFRGVIRNKKIEIYDKTELNTWLQKHEGQEIKFGITPVLDKRTIPQNRLYWLYLGIISEETGHSPEELHEFFKHRFLPWRITTIYNTPLQIRGTTTELSVAGFSEYMERIQQLTEIPIPDTSKVWDYQHETV